MRRAALAQDAELAKIREEIRQMKEGYEKRIQTLEKRLEAAEAKTGRAEQSAAKAETAGAGSASRSSESAFNPAISLILQGTYARTSQDPNQFQITGFMPSGGEVGPPKRSFGLAETSSTSAPTSIRISAAWRLRRWHPKAESRWRKRIFRRSRFLRIHAEGRAFLFRPRYLNEQHQHAWDFPGCAARLQGVSRRSAEAGRRAGKWVAPTDLFVEIGAELSAGDQFPGSDRNKNGVGGSAIFAHLGGDIGASTAWRLGASYLRLSPSGRAYQDTDALGGAVTNTFNGSAKLWGLDGVLKWSPNGNPARPTSSCKASTSGSSKTARSHTTILREARSLVR
jgi:hypothetical protein